MFTFAVVTPDRRFQDNRGWYVVMDPSDTSSALDIIDKMHSGVTRTMFLKTSASIMSPEKLSPAERAMYGNETFRPVHFGAKYANTLTTKFFAKQKLLINSSGGWIPYDESLIKRTVESTVLEFPPDSAIGDDKTCTEIISISRYADGKHYYLTSSTNRALEKQNSYSEAMKEARKYVPEDNIVFRNPKKHIYRREGD